MDHSSREARISQRMRDALIADLVMADPTDDYWFGVKWSSEDVTDHLSRQLGIRSAPLAAGVHETLLMIATEVNDLLRTWPLPEELAPCQAIAHEATKHLGAMELVGTLLAGPPRWQNAGLPASKVERLENHLQPLLERLLASELSSLFGRWAKWDIRKLREHRETALAASKKAFADEAARISAERIANRVPYVRPSGKDREDRYKPPFQPRGRT